MYEQIGSVNKEKNYKKETNGNCVTEKYHGLN